MSCKVLTTGVFNIWLYWLPKVLRDLHKLVNLTQLFLRKLKSKATRNEWREECRARWWRTFSKIVGSSFFPRKRWASGPAGTWSR